MFTWYMMLCDHVNQSVCDDKSLPTAGACQNQAGSFVVLFPQDAHAPGCEADGKSSVKKIIGKVLLG